MQLRIVMDELRSSAIETEPSVIGVKSRMVVDMSATTRGDGMKDGQLPSPVDPRLLKVLIDGACKLRCAEAGGCNAVPTCTHDAVWAGGRAGR